MTGVLPPDPAYLPTPCKACGKHTTTFVWCFDEGSGGRHAHNLYACDTCGAVEVERVWANDSSTIVHADGRVEERAREP